MLMDLFLVIICHSYAVIKKHTIIKKLKKCEPLIIINKEIGIKIIELMILFVNSWFIKYYQNFFLFFCNY